MRRIAFIALLTLAAAACDAGDPLAGFTPRQNLPATQLAVTTQPTDVVVLDAFSPPIQVEIRNINNQLAVNSTLPVTMQLTPGTGTPGASLSGQLVVNAVNGVATFNNLRINQAGTGYTLTATAPNLTSAISAPFNVNP